MSSQKRPFAFGAQARRTVLVTEESPNEVLEEIRQGYREAAVAFPWQRGDMLLLDNFLASHGREPFTGPRRIVVAMAELYTAPTA